MREIEHGKEAHFTNQNAFENIWEKGINLEDSTYVKYRGSWPRGMEFSVFVDKIQVVCGFD